jgi:hypothetical protein
MKYVLSGETTAVKLFEIKTDTIGRISLKDTTLLTSDKSQYHYVSV